MSSEPATTAPIRLDYTLTPEDLRDAVAAQQRRGWLRRRVPMMIVVVAAATLTGLAAARVWEMPPGAALIAIVLAAAVASVLGTIAVLVLNLILAGVYRWQAHLLIRGNPSLSQPAQGTVTATGIHLRSATDEATYGWASYPLAIETDRSFVLLASRGLGAMVIVLPKRGVVDTDPSHLRALLTTHAQFIGKAG
ncbi:YcxB family protein [Actinoplanes sp. NBC_00393]|uniref:YcxB family protein n=1 Tax=Actinoplanes sp. NBC_00393 TaxID=2975953 RepID=UPI002E1F7B24